MKLLLLSGLLILNIYAGENSGAIIHQNGFSASQKLGVLKVLKCKKKFAVLTEKGIHPVHSYDVDALLKKMNNEQLVEFLNKGNGTIEVSQFDNGEFNLRTHVNGKGGGPIGATVGATVGVALVQGTAHTVIWGIATLTGPFFWYVGSGLEYACAPAIHTATVYAAAVGGMTGAVATGPI